MIEEPGCLGAIQAFSIFKPKFVTVPLTSAGIDTQLMSDALDNHDPCMAYLIPNFQNPSGITYSSATREKVAELCRGRQMYIVEDDPYGDIRFTGKSLPSLAHYLPDQTVLLGTFSKTVVPAFRMGWVVAPDELMERLIVD